MASFFFRVYHVVAVPVHSYVEVVVRVEMAPAGRVAA